MIHVYVQIIHQKLHFYKGWTIEELYNRSWILTIQQKHLETTFHNQPLLAIAHYKLWICTKCFVTKVPLGF